ncbi:MAG: palmitoyltransferase swf1 [Vezdaea acicularis]|nr:MAG: palmitoyltransferase swf1 [Vezdaea acicularis]
MKPLYVFIPTIMSSTTQTRYALLPARSKHCRICKVCVAKSDHHCAWVNNCVGYSNYHWFLLMILSTAILVTYGTWLGYSIMSRFLQNEHQALNQHWSIGLTWPAYLQDWAWAISKELGIGAIGLLCFLCAPMLWILFGYHIYLLWAGMTTNESSKWEDWKEDMQDGLVFKARWTDVKAVATSTLGHEAEDPELDVPWPVSSDQFLVLTKDGQPPVMMSTSENAPNRPQWEKIRDLGEVNNIYDLGFWDNIMDVFMRQKL